MYTYKSLSRLTSSRQTCALCHTHKSGGNFAPLPFPFPKSSSILFGNPKSVHLKNLRSIRKLRHGRLYRPKPSAFLWTNSLTVHRRTPTLKGYNTTHYTIVVCYVFYHNGSSKSIDYQNKCLRFLESFVEKIRLTQIIY